MTIRNRRLPKACEASRLSSVTFDQGAIVCRFHTSSPTRATESRSTSKIMRARNEPWSVGEHLPVRDYHNDLSHEALSRLRRRRCSSSVAIFNALHCACWWLSLYAVAVARWRWRSLVSAMADWRERDRSARRRSSLLSQLLRVRAVHVRCVRVEALQICLHDSELILEHFILLVCFTSIISVASQATHILRSSCSLVLQITDILDRCSLISSCRTVKTSNLHTFGENLPLAGLGATVIWHGLVQVVEKILHFTPALPFCKLVADAKLRSATVVAKSSS